MPSLTGMRFIAAVMVFALGATFYLFEQPNFTAMEITWQLAAAGVSYFFILSGFILAWSTPASDTARSFWRRRFFKIYPNHVVTLVASLVILTLVVGEAVGNWLWLPNLLLVQSFSPDLYVRGSLNGVAWTLSCEAFFYFSFPFLMAGIRRIRREWLWPAAGTVVAAIFAVPLLAAATAPANQEAFLLGTTPWETYIIYQFPVTRMLEFVLGIVIARLVMTGRQRWPGLIPSGALVIGAFVLAPQIPAAYGVVAVTAIPLALLIVAGAVADIRKQPTWLSGRTMVWLGEISFSFYLWHYLILLLGFHWLIVGNGMSTPVVLAIAAGLFGVTLVVSWLQFTLIERPIMRRFARPRSRRPRLAVITGSAADPAPAQVPVTSTEPQRHRAA